MSSTYPPDGKHSHIADWASDTNNAHMPTHKRDPTYYYPSGNVIFLVDGVLFKVYDLLILPADSTTRNVGRQRYPLGAENLPETLSDSSDTHPIVLPDITAIQFRNYLLALLGRIYDPEYCSLLTGANNKDRHSRDLLVRLLDITDVSHQFGMSKLREWAFSQLELVLESMHELAKMNWDKDTLLRLHSCARSSGRPKLMSSTANFIQYFISLWTVPEDENTERKHASSNLDTCVQLFKDPKLPGDDPAMFGCVFASILALGHRSATWTSDVTRSQRAVLYAAQVQFTASNDELQSSRWLVESHPSQFVIWICEQCFGEFSDAWATSFKKYHDLKSTGRLQGLIALARLPQYRRSFSTSIRSDIGLTPHGDRPARLSYRVSCYMNDKSDKKVFSVPGCLPPNLPGDTRPRDRIRCTEREWPLGYLDHHIRLLHQDLAARYKEIASEV